MPKDGIADNLVDILPQAPQGFGVRKNGTQDGHTGFPSLINPALANVFSHLIQTRP
jgi:hypothetical protein